jgi:uncharacterized protein involved in exopolysaccharide biosynthesis
MDDPQSATPGSGTWTQAKGADLDAEEVGGVLSLRTVRFLRLCWVRRRMVFGILFTGILLSLLYALSLPNLYTSTTTLMPPDSASFNSNLIGLISTTAPTASAGSALLGMKTLGAVFSGILGSRTVKESLVKQFDLVHQYQTPLIEDACKRLTADTVIQENPKSGVIAISVRSANPVLASKLAQGYVAELDHVLTNNSTSAARRERIFLEGRIKEIKIDLDDSAETLSQFSAKNKTIDIPAQGKATIDAKLKLQTELVSSRTDLAGLRQAYSENNVRIRVASARVQELQRQIDKIAGAPQKDHSAVDTNDSDYPSVRELPALGLTYSDLDRRVRVEETLWEALTKQYEAAKVQEAKEIPTARVLDAANVPQHKSSPVRSSIMILGTLLSLLCAFFAMRITASWEELDAKDERKKLVAKILNTQLNSHQWFWHLPGICWVHTKLRRAAQR